MINFYKPQEERLFNTNDISRTLKVSITFVTSCVRKLGLHPQVVQNRTHAYYFTRAEYKLIEDYVNNNKRIAGLRRDKNILNEDAREHPLVTYKRCLNLYYWPDIVPDCFKDMEEV